MTATAKAPVKVSLPAAEQDRALTSKVGIVALLGFAVGVAWPRLFGISVGPDVPGGGPAPSASAAKPQASAQAPAMPAGSADEEPAGEPEQGPSNRQAVVVAAGVIQSCKNKKGDKLEECGKLAFDKLATSRLTELSTCPAALGLKGELTLILAVNFDKSEVTVEGEKRKTKIPSDTLRGVISCAAERLKGLELDKLGHTHPRYSIAYKLSFYPPGEAPPPAAGTPEEAAEKEDEGLGRATVTNERANLRDTPKDGKIVAKLPQGTRVKLLEQKDDWYLVESKKGKGWVYRQAIGR